jgi:hypothetical protein
MLILLIIAQATSYSTKKLLYLSSLTNQKFVFFFRYCGRFIWILLLLDGQDGASQLVHKHVQVFLKASSSSVMVNMLSAIVHLSVCHKLQQCPGETIQVMNALDFISNAQK